MKPVANRLPTLKKGDKVMRVNWPDGAYYEIARVAIVNGLTEITLVYNQVQYVITDFSQWRWIES